MAAAPGAGMANPLVRIAAAEAMVAIGAAAAGRAVLESLLTTLEPNSMLPLYIGQAYVTWPEALAGTPRSAFVAALNRFSDAEVGERFRYLRDR
jgi:hypothetical protein